MSTVAIGHQDAHLSAVQGEEFQQAPLVPRLDRLDRLLHYLEEKHNLSERRSNSYSETKTEGKKQCKPLSSVLEKVYFKGTLLERVAMLENRVLQLSLEMEDRSISSSSTIRTFETHGLLEKNNKELPSTLLERQDPNKIQGKALQEGWTCKPQAHKRSSRHKGTLPIKRSRKWLGWLQF